MSYKSRIIILLTLIAFMMVGGMMSCSKVNDNQVSKPYFQKEEGNYRSGINIQIATETENAIIYYTEDGSEPTADSEKYSKPIPISGQGAEKRIKAIAMKEGMETSEVSSSRYTVDKGGIYYPKWLRPEIPGMPIPIHWYGLMYVFVAITTYILMRLQVKKNPAMKNEVTADDIDFIFIWAVIGAILGARLAHVLFIDPFVNVPGHKLILSEPWKIILPIDFTPEGVKFTGIAGMSFYGGIFGVIITVSLYCKRKKLSFIRVGDMIATAFPLGYTFGRLGNFFNQEFQGYPAPKELPWKMYYWTNIYSSDVTYQNVARHPSQIYEAIVQGIILWLVMWFIIKPRKMWDGFMMACFVSGYGVARFFTEFFRVRNDPLDGVTTLTTSQWVCFGLIIVGIIIGYITKKFSERKSVEKS